jgi:ribonuclease VapC
VTAAQARIARDAHRDFAYALARAIGEPLLFKGDDFSHTDVAAA